MKTFTFIDEGDYEVDGDGDVLLFVTEGKFYVSNKMLEKMLEESSQAISNQDKDKE